MEDHIYSEVISLSLNNTERRLEILELLEGGDLHSILSMVSHNVHANFCAVTLNCMEAI